MISILIDHIRHQTDYILKRSTLVVAQVGTRHAAITSKHRSDTPAKLILTKASSMRLSQRHHCSIVTILKELKYLEVWYLQRQ